MEKRIVRARAPLRLGLAGGGTDVSPYCDQFGGYVLNVTIDKYAYAVAELLDDGRVDLVADDMQERWTGSLSEIWDEKGGCLPLHRAVYRRVVSDFLDGRPISVRLTTFSDAPPGSGLGSSSTLVVAMVQAFVELFGLPLGEYDVARLAYQIERVDVGLTGGKQDQYAATFGGFNFIEFHADERVIVNPLRIKHWVVSELESSLLLHFTGVSRESAEIIEAQRNNVERKDVLSLHAMHEVKQEASLMKEALLRGDFDMLLASMRRGWESKKRMADAISNDHIDSIYEVAMQAGAMAGKVTGAGGGGFMMFLVDPARRMCVRRALEVQGGQVVSCHFTKYGAQAWRVG